MCDFFGRRAARPLPSIFVPRKPRVQAPDVLYHVTTRGVEKRDIFRGTKSYLMFLELLEQTVFRYGWICHSYCLMKNHYHLAVETPQANISAGMQFLKGEHASWFNVTYGREGTLHERRFRDTIATDEGHAAHLSRYLVLNPVRSGFERNPEDWHWSSYNATIGLAKRPRFLTIEPTLDLFGGGPLGAARFTEFVEEELLSARLAASQEAMSGSDPGMARLDMAA
jgi:REP element-mobilizing transposase RayT